MKYWRGYLTAGILGAITWVLLQFGNKFATLVDMVYPYITRTLQTMLSDWSSGADFLLWQVIAVFLGVLLLASIVLMIVLKWNPFQWFGWVLAAASCLFMLHTVVYGLNTYAGPLAEDIRMDTSDYTLSEIVDAVSYYRDKANDLAAEMPRDEKGDLIYSSFEELAEQAGEGFDYLVYERSFSVFAGTKTPVKKLGWADMYSSMGITGFTMGLTGEAAVNPQIPAVSLPFTMCHEMAHRMSIVVERDANFGAFLACRFNSSKEFQYSAYFMAYRYSLNTLRSLSSSSSNLMVSEITAGVNEQLAHDMAAYDEFFASKRDDTATKIADTTNDTYLKTTGDDAGIKSYGNVGDLLVNWYIQEIILPTQVEEETKFDPYDETQVDLRGIVNAKLTGEE
ncbi:MAG: DUF3810 domain-containing protein [Oscillospiraceae bacterium]|nr:DUF3810 domain-containing protein [Oscillospiraceae bacterium]